MKVLYLQYLGLDIRISTCFNEFVLLKIFKKKIPARCTKILLVLDLALQLQQNLATGAMYTYECKIQHDPIELLSKVSQE